MKPNSRTSYRKDIRRLNFEQLFDPVPHTLLLSNSRYTTLITHSGAGFSSFDGHALTRWQADRIEDGEGFFLYLRDLDSKQFWSLGHQPVRQDPEHYVSSFHSHRAEISSLNHGIEARMEIAVPADANLELRRCTLYNRTKQRRRIELTSYAEVVLNQMAADRAHPAFSKLFIQTEHLPEHHALLARRRPRSAGEATMLMFHWGIAGESTQSVQYETDRARFIGRGRNLAAPAALAGNTPLSGTVGNVLDPIFSLRYLIEIEPHGEQEISFALGAAYEHEEAIALIERYRDTRSVDQALRDAETQGHKELEDLGIPPSQAHDIQRLAGALLYGDPQLRAPEQILAKYRGDQSRLNRYGLRPHLPLVMLQLNNARWKGILTTLITAQAFWMKKTLVVDLLVLIDPSIRQHRDAIRQEIERLGKALWTSTHSGHIVVKCGDEFTPQDLILAQSVARIYVNNEMPDPLPLETPIPGQAATPIPKDQQRFIPAVSPGPSPTSPPLQGEAQQEELLFDNGLGGFTQDGKEYVIHINPMDSKLPPLPWTNVIANEHFGTILSERGSAFTWSQNSREHRLTPWYNDPVIDPHGEALYLRDEQAGVFWSPTPGPIPQQTHYKVVHGFGYTTYRHTSQELEQELCVFVPRHAPLKIVRLQLRNLSDTRRELSVFSYQRLVLGVLAQDNAAFIKTFFDEQAGALLATNQTVEEYAARVVFATLLGPNKNPVLGFTADRQSFIGRNGCPSRPAALGHAEPLNKRTGSGLDPCLALQLPVELAPGETVTCALLFGEADSMEHMRSLVRHYQDFSAIDQALAQVQTFWEGTLGTLQIQTPTPAIDVMVNGWLSYQNLSCRLWARSAFYQSGGAFGFRDQLQDAAALIYLSPELTRQQILLHAAHQFIEGDVLHWWHPPTDIGIRTRFSDDLLWLPLFTAFYVRTTGDRAILDEPVRFVEARILAPGEDEVFLLPEDSGQHAALYEHCCRSLDRSLTKGAHGLPLMGTGDWNDGMNRVGREGRGESVWLGFFIYYILDRFIPICEARHDRQRVRCYRDYRTELQKTLNDSGWDGAWYRRAYFDDGTPLGSAQNEECRIDALAQAWAVISKAAPADRVEQAMDALERYLISEPEGIIRLLSPAFDQTPWDPGYIKGYLPGVRENGGQYTHAALWAVQAMAEAGRIERATTLLDMINPINHARTPDETATYQVEPYVIAADVYGVSPHVGRGGWTWYTGSAGWMYRIALESVLGFQLVEGNSLHLKPRIPKTWKGFKLSYRCLDKKTLYEIRVSNDAGGSGTVVAVDVDGEMMEIEDETARIPLLSDGMIHQVHVRLE